VEESFPNEQYWATYDKGGHVAAIEVPDIFVNDLRTFFASFR
jgi:hypothetical protein